MANVAVRPCGCQWVGALDGYLIRCQEHAAAFAAEKPAVRVRSGVGAAIGSVDRLRCCPDMKHGCAGHHHPITQDTRDSLASLITATVVEALDAT